MTTLASLLVWAAAAGSLHATSQVDARLDTVRARIGDRLTLTLTAHSGSGETVQFPDMESLPNEFEVLAELPSERVDGEGGSALVRNSYQITAFETGSVQIPELPFAVMSADGSVDTLWSRPIDVTFVPVVRDTLNAELRPLRALLDVPRLWKKIALWAVAGLVVLVALILLWRAYLRRRAQRLAGELKSTKPKRPAYLIALDELDRIKSLGLIEKGEIKQFHILVSDAVRHYLDDRYDVDALEMTTWELMSVLQRRPNLDSEMRALIQEFLESCDLVKFAKYKPLIVEINSTFNHAYEIVEKSRPRLPAGQAPSAPPSVVSAASGDSGEARR